MLRITISVHFFKQRSGILLALSVQILYKYTLLPIIWSHTLITGSVNRCMCVNTLSLTFSLGFVLTRVRNEIEIYFFTHTYTNSIQKSLQACKGFNAVLLLYATDEYLLAYIQTYRYIYNIYRYLVFWYIPSKVNLFLKWTRLTFSSFLQLLVVSCIQFASGD